MNHNGASNFPLNPVDKFEEAFMGCLTSLTKDDTFTNLDREEIKLDAEIGFQNVIDCARAMEGYFLKKRLEIASQKPELLVKDDSSELRFELVRKDELLKKHFDNVNYWQSILADLQSANSSVKPPGPGQAGIGPLNMQPGSQGPLTPAGRPATPGSAGRPQTPVSSTGSNIPQLPSARMQTTRGRGRARNPGSSGLTLPKEPPKKKQRNTPAMKPTPRGKSNKGSSASDGSILSKALQPNLDERKSGKKRGKSL